MTNVFGRGFDSRQLHQKHTWPKRWLDWNTRLK